MKKTLTLLLLVAGSLSATSFSIAPDSGLVFGSPGQTVGWGFTTTNDDFVQWISFSQSVLMNESNPLLGTYTDLIGPQGGPNNFTVDPAATWSQSFDAANQAGLGQFTIAPDAIVGSSDSGLIRVFYNFEDGTPGSIDVPFQVQVQAAETGTPEPGTYGMLLLGVAVMFVARRSSRRYS